VPNGRYLEDQGLKSPIEQEGCHMKRQTEREQLNRLTVKTLDQVFIMKPLPVI
jgi:hypothetical protein